MPNFSPDRLLDVWENHWNRTPCEQAVALAANCFPELTLREILELPIGRRDILLMSLRSSLFGSTVTLVSQCPLCDEQNELTFDLPEVDSETLSLKELLVQSEERNSASACRVVKTCLK